MAKILLVEDEPQLGAQVALQLRRTGFEVDWLQDGDLLVEAEFDRYQLVILDVMVPSIRGADIFRTLRSRSDVPVLMLSTREGAQDRAHTLQLGADDYLTKPFWPADLLERVRARLRRPTEERGDDIILGPLRMALTGRVVRMGGRPMALTRIEFDLLFALAHRPGQTILRKWLFEHVLRSKQISGRERSLDVHVSRLRKKLRHCCCIQAVWGVGYRFTLEESQ